MELEESRALGSRKPGPVVGRENLALLVKTCFYFLLLSLSNILLDLSSTLNRGMVIFPSFHFVCGFKVNPFRLMGVISFLNRIEGCSQLASNFGTTESSCLSSFFINEKDFAFLFALCSN